MQRDLVISSQLININKVRFFLEEVFNESHLDKVLFNRIFLGLSEAVNNSIVHGNRLNTEKHVCIQITLNESQILIVVEDEGDGFCADDVGDPTFQKNLKKENGRGIFLLRQIADEVDYLEGGRKVLIKYFLANEHTIL